LVLFVAISRGRIKPGQQTALMESALRAITKADGFGILPAYKDVKI